MDKDKLHTAAMEYAEIVANGAPLAHNSFLGGANWLMQQPLSERLTEDEKEKIRAIYKDNEELETYGETLSDRTAGRMQCFTLEQIFGADLFNEK